MNAPETFEARLVSSSYLSASVKELRFERVDGKPFHFAPGQWVNLVLPCLEGSLRRAYSLASAPDETTGFCLIVTKVEGGPGSTFLHDLQVRQCVDVQGPRGMFTRDEPMAPALFVATGTGLAPLRSMLLAAQRQGNSAAVTLLFGARTEGDLLYRSEFEAWALESASARYAPTLSRPSSSWSGQAGYVQEHLAQAWTELKARSLGLEPHLFVCGLDRMVSAVRELARGPLGLSRRQVHTERFDG